MSRARVRVGMASCGLAAGAELVRIALEQALGKLGVDAELGAAGCLGLCHREVLVELRAPGEAAAIYGEVTPEGAEELVRAHFIDGRRLEDRLVLDDAAAPPPVLAQQTRVVLARAGRVDPESLSEYLEAGGGRGLARALALGPERVREEILAAGLRGRGGGGFATGRKWAMAAAQPDPVRYVVGNADEGDPGAFMDRAVLESDPFAVLEGLLIAGLAVGAERGYIYVRHEYPLARARLETALGAARDAGFLGPEALGRGRPFDVEVRRGAGAFVCGEETALIASLEGRRGLPTLRPPYPVVQGFRGHPTVINNVETLATVPFILDRGAPAFRALGTPSSPGTKTFCLAGDVRRGGMVEVEMGVSVRALVEDLGGGSASGRPVRAVQIGGPSGGCLPAERFDVPIDFDALAETGTMMGSGGIVVLDTSRCMVDVARYFVRFMADESCGQCTACREGTVRLAEILDRVSSGTAVVADLERLDLLAAHVARGSLCGLGRSAPNPLLSTLRWFRDDYDAHVRDRRCATLACRSLRRYGVRADRCDGCGACARACPTDAVEIGGGAIAATLDAAACIRCDACRQACAFDAIEVRA
jgi:NADH-quinone oxidoreductase subunit F